MDMNFAVIAKPKGELARVLKCLVSRGHTLLLIDPPDKECSFSVESLLAYAHLIVPASDSMVEEEEEYVEEDPSHVEQDLYPYTYTSDVEEEEEEEEEEEGAFVSANLGQKICWRPKKKKLRRFQLVKDISDLNTSSKGNRDESSLRNASAMKNGVVSVLYLTKILSDAKLRRERQALEKNTRTFSKKKLREVLSKKRNNVKFSHRQNGRQCRGLEATELVSDSVGSSYG
ncbi:hypothetical protein YC2023_008095 [Brassica napus]